MSWRARLKVSRVGWILLAMIGLSAVTYLCWSPGSRAALPSGRTHATWLSHAWWAEPGWQGSVASSMVRRDEAGIATMARDLHAAGIRRWFVHACPSRADGTIPEVDRSQALRLVAANQGGEVLAWVGGVLDENVFPARASWRERFAASCARLVREGGLAGIHLNIEPCPEGTPGYLTLLDELRRQLPVSAQLSVAAYPPPTRWQPVPEVHWSRPANP